MCVWGRQVRRVADAAAETSSLSLAVAERLPSLRRALWDVRALRVAVGAPLDVAAACELLREAAELCVDNSHSVLSSLVEQARAYGVRVARGTARGRLRGRRMTRRGAGAGRSAVRASRWERCSGAR